MRLCCLLLIPCNLTVGQPLTMHFLSRPDGGFGTGHGPSEVGLQEADAFIALHYYYQSYHFFTNTDTLRNGYHRRNSKSSPNYNLQHSPCSDIPGRLYVRDNSGLIQTTTTSALSWISAVLVCVPPLCNRHLLLSFQLVVSLLQIPHQETGENKHYAEASAGDEARAELRCF